MTTKGCKGPLKGGCPRRICSACLWEKSVVLQPLPWMAISNVLFSTCTLPLKRTLAVRQIPRLPRQNGTGGSPNTASATKNGTRGWSNTAPATKSHSLKRRGLTMKQPITLRFSISRGSYSGQNRGTPHAKTQIITLESNIMLVFRGRRGTQVEIIMLETRHFFLLKMCLQHYHFHFCPTPATKKTNIRVLQHFRPPGTSDSLRLPRKLQGAWFTKYCTWNEKMQ